MKTLVKALITILGCAAASRAQWVMTTSTNAAVRAIALDVHSVRTDERFVYVESAGLSLSSFGPLEANQYDPPAGPRKLSFRLPRAPKPAAQPVSTPLGMIGVFVTGAPIYNPIGTNSWQNQNIWHQDAVKASPARMTVRSLPSPIMGFALDGYPIYSPAGFRSSYRLRAITQRTTLPDGTVLTPGQEGPPVDAEHPLGTYAEDYEFVPGSGDLDEFNGREADGAYHYYMTPTWPYLVGRKFRGEVPFDTPARVTVTHAKGVDLWTDRAAIEAGQPVNLTLVFRTRFLEVVHEKPVHLMVVSKDLAEFDHVHPVAIPGDAFSIAHTFARPGEYWIYADYTAPGEPPSIARFVVQVGGKAGEADAAYRDPEVHVEFGAPARIEVNRDVPLSFTLSNAKTGQPVADVEPWLGAWAHVTILSEDGEVFIHAHPLESAAVFEPAVAHSHTAPVAGPSPQTIRTQIGFNKPGIYQVWFQFQRGGRVSTVAQTVRVEAGAARPGSPATTPPADAIPVTVSRDGFQPARVVAPAGKPIRIAFRRLDAQNCASEVVFPRLGIRKTLPVGETVVVELPAREAGQVSFACGMGMYKGTVVVR